MPLGEVLWQEDSRAQAVRITDVSEKGIREEVSFAGEIRGFGRLEGLNGRIIGTDRYAGSLREAVVSGTARGVLVLGDATVAFKAVGLAKLVKRSPIGAESILALVSFVDPPPELDC